MVQPSLPCPRIPQGSAMGVHLDGARGVLINGGTPGSCAYMSLPLEMISDRQEMPRTTNFTYRSFLWIVGYGLVLSCGDGGVIKAGAMQRFSFQRCHDASSTHGETSPEGSSN